MILKNLYTPSTNNIQLDYMLFGFDKTVEPGSESINR
jgi:hypothetical protein